MEKLRLQEEQCQGVGDSGFLLWPAAWLWVCLMTPEAQEGQACVQKPGLVLAIADSGLSGLAGRLPQWPVCPLSHPPLEPGDPAEGPPERASPRRRGPPDPQVPDVPHHAGGLQPAPRGLPRPHLPPHPHARLLCPPRGGEGPSRQGLCGGAPPLFPCGLGLGCGHSSAEGLDARPTGL